GLGVPGESVCQKGYFRLSPEGGVWAVGQRLGHLQAFTWPGPTSLPHEAVSRRIEVALGYTCGQVAFWDADQKTEIF
ncbi:RNF39 protein, partial [Bucco capensis]|nr:RNF39 protein [Bucco capensis]